MADTVRSGAAETIAALNLSKPPFVLRLSRRARAIVRQTISFSVAVILALVGLTILTPLLLPAFRLPLPVGVLCHEGSMLIVAFNGLRMLMIGSEE